MCRGPTAHDCHAHGLALHRAGGRSGGTESSAGRPEGCRPYSLCAPPTPPAEGVPRVCLPPSRCRYHWHWLPRSSAGAACAAGAAAHAPAEQGGRAIGRKLGARRGLVGGTLGPPLCTHRHEGLRGQCSCQCHTSSLTQSSAAQRRHGAAVVGTQRRRRRRRRRCPCCSPAPPRPCFEGSDLCGRGRGLGAGAGCRHAEVSATTRAEKADKTKSTVWG